MYQPQKSVRATSHYTPSAVMCHKLVLGQPRGRSSSPSMRRGIAKKSSTLAAPAAASISRRVSSELPDQSTGYDSLSMRRS